MTAFRERAAQGELFAQAIHDLMRFCPGGMIRNVSRAGVERGDLADIIDELHRSPNPMEKRLRFNPDGVVFSGGLAHWEAKASEFIEKTPFEFYLEYERRGEPVLLFIAPGLLTSMRAPIYCGRVRDLVLMDGREYEQQFPQPRPVDADGWIRPRSDRFGIRQSRSGLAGSGTPFKKINIGQSRMVKLSRARFMRGDDGIQRCEIALALFVGDLLARQISIDMDAAE